ncbi:hypothetical protein F2P81_017762 [Scophthalmus maximus]|uniref:Mannan-binding lectin serine protease 1 n=1 Tax=Scophthalmus maximus TaxID=52904 RepID=A0A6A4SIS1_SCOMX|nr:hypothetical protein F2P81_017762 [Scophthalmus maximus]
MRSFVFLVLVMLVVDAQPSSLSDMYGSLHSPNFPEPYPRETQLRWNISVPDGFQIKLYFSHFDLEPSYLCEYDFVKVEAESEVLGLFCGRDETDTEAVPGQQVVTSPRHSLSVVFSSDFSNEERNSGFMAHYRAEDVDECSDRGDEDEDLICDHFCHNFIGGYYCSCRYGYLLHTDNRTCRVECSDGVFRERSGVLSSVDFPAPYPKSSECSYRIEVETGFRLRLQFEPDFDVEDHPDVRCPYDYVKTDSNIVTVDFHSDNSGDNLGWKMTYTSTGSQCPVPETPPNAVMNPVQSEYSFKDHILFTCEPGYRLMKDGDSLDQLQLDCGSDGSWSSRLPQCQMVDCGSPQAVHMADVVFGNHDNSTLFGSTVRYVCRGDAFDLNASNSELMNIMNYYYESDPMSLSEEMKTVSQIRTAVDQRDGGPVQSQDSGSRAVLKDLTRVPEDRWFGSGALLSESWVLTAAHVLRAQRRDASIVSVAPEHVKDDPSSPVPNSLGVVAGWGITVPNVSSSTPGDPPSLTSDLLQYVKLPVVPQDECQASYTSRSVSYNITDNMFCAGFFEGGRDTCLGDSGGAFVMEDEFHEFDNFCVIKCRIFVHETINVVIINTVISQ